MNKLAQTTLDFAPSGGYKGFGILGLENSSNSSDADRIFQNVISSTIGIISIVAIIWFVITIITSGISYMSAGADQKAAEAARKRITNGMIGLVITIFGIFIINIIGQFFNIPNILQVNMLIDKVKVQ